ncbi:hypothetical protein ACFX2I_040716 [Malus domestica]
MPKEQEGEAVPSSSKDDHKPAKPTTIKGSAMPSKGPNTHVFRYIPMSRRKNGQSPIETGTSKANTQLDKDVVKLLKINVVLPLTQLSDSKISKPPLSLLKPLPNGAEQSALPTKRTKEGFDPNTYKLMSKAGYDFVSPSNLGRNVLNTINDKEHDFIETQKRLKKHGYGVDNNKAGLGFTLNTPVKISRKTKNASAQHISVSVEQNQEEPKPAPRTSVFDRLNCSKPRISTLDCIGDQEQTSVFKRLNMPTPQSSVFKRLSKPKKQSNTVSFPPRRSALERLVKTKTYRKRKTMPNEEKLDGLVEKDNVRSLIPLRMKHQAT